MWAPPRLRFLARDYFHSVSSDASKKNLEERLLTQFHNSLPLALCLSFELSAKLEEYSDFQALTTHPHYEAPKTEKMGASEKSAHEQARITLF